MLPSPFFLPTRYRYLVDDAERPSPVPSASRLVSSARVAVLGQHMSRIALRSRLLLMQYTIEFSNPCTFFLLHVFINLSVQVRCMIRGHTSVHSPAVAHAANDRACKLANAGPKHRANASARHPRSNTAYRLYIGSISALPTACPLRGYGRAGTQNDRLVILGTGTPIPLRNGHAVGDADIEQI